MTTNQEINPRKKSFPIRVSCQISKFNYEVTENVLK